MFLMCITYTCTTLTMCECESIIIIDSAKKKKKIICKSHAVKKEVPCGLMYKNVWGHASYLLTAVLQIDTPRAIKNSMALYSEG